ncbi:MAG TPA: transcription antitermination factor NusB [Vicinamibacterales bacterium]|jgi:N utilization substance protein B|nr:transcription antitermination factor NusB [Vicinamibacterales bacterium]
MSGAARHRARAAALQMLYQWEVGRTPVDEVVRTYWAGRDAPPDPDDELSDAAPEAVLVEEERSLANALVAGTIERMGEADELIGAHARNWRIGRMAVIDRLVLRLAIFELLSRPDTPAAVVINEALELARTFSGEEPVPFINGVLDAVRKSLGRDG